MDTKNQMGKKTAWPPPAKKAKKASKAGKAAEKAAGKAAEKAEKQEEPMVLTKNKKPATTKKPAPKKSAPTPPPPPVSDDKSEDADALNDEYESPGAEEELNYMAEDDDEADDGDAEPEDGVTMILHEEAAESPLKTCKKHAPNIVLMHKQWADIVEFVKSHANLYHHGEPEFFLKHVRDKTWEECAVQLELNGNYTFLNFMWEGGIDW